MRINKELSFFRITMTFIGSVFVMLTLLTIIKAVYDAGRERGWAECQVKVSEAIAVAKKSNDTAEACIAELKKQLDIRKREHESESPHRSR